VKGWKEIDQVNGPQKQVGIAILISDKVDFKFTVIKWDKEGNFILIKGVIHQKEIKIINLCALNVSSHNFIKHTLKDWKAHIDSNTIVVGDFYTPVSWIDRSSKQKNQQILEINDTINKMDLTDIYRIFHPTTVQYTLF
jgi:hypothetical protein